MANTAYAEAQHEEQRTQVLRAVEAETARSRSRSDILELVGFALLILACWFIAALLFVPQLSGLL
jgi:hypothetical protein